MLQPASFLKQITASFAQPAAENPTVEMIEAAYKHHRLPWRYINFEVPPEALSDAVKGARALGFAGFNCSLPHKVAVIKELDGLGESASIMGAVNCVVRREGRYIGENTDGKGFLESLRKKVNPAHKDIVLLGAGGTARAVGVEVALAGAGRITIVNRSQQRGHELVDLLNAETPAEACFFHWIGDYNVPAETNVVVNATSVGLYPNVDARLRINVETLQPDMVVADVIPNPLRTRFVRGAERRGCTVIDGLGMLVNQGVISVKYWTGVDVQAMGMRDRVVEILGLSRIEKRH